MPQFTRFACLVALLASVVAPLRAQRLSVTDPTAAPVIIESADVRCEVTGRLAVTTFDLVFRNPNGRVLEGTFEFPLLSGQSVVRFALDVGGHLREAVPVEKNRGRVVFEEVERRGVDPGLLEQTAGQNYRARVYPIPARGTRRVVVAYQEDVLRSGRAIYRLPLDFAEPLKAFGLRVTADTGAAETPKVHTTLPLQLPAWRDARVLEVTRSDFTARGVVELELPTATRPQVLTQRRGGGEFFYAEVPLPAVKPLPRAVPHAIGIIWDASGSGRNRDHGRELALLQAWFSVVPSVHVKLVLLRDHAGDGGEFEVRNGDWTALRRRLEHMVYDGATSFDGLADDPAMAEWLLFSDGLVNYGATQGAAKLPMRAPVHTIVSGMQADRARLHGIADRNGGEFVDLLQRDPNEGVAVLRTQSLRVLGVERDPEDVAEVYPETSSPVSGGTLIVSGRLKSRDATLRIRVGHNASDATTAELRVQSGENPSELAARAWATQKLASLEATREANKEDIRRASEEFGIVTATSSLIVLETLQDYIRYDIVPPEELRAQWDAYRQRGAQARQKGYDQHLEAVVRGFEERETWWKREFPKGKSKAGEEAEREDANEAAARAAARRFEQMQMRETPALAQRAAAQDEVVQLSPFAVAADRQLNFGAGNTLAGSRVPAYPSAPAANAPAVVAGRIRRDKDIGDAVDADGSSGASSIALQRWEADAGYLDRLRRSAGDEAYAVYLEERSSHLRQPGFFLDVAEFFFEEKQTELALRILSNLAELQLDDPPLLRVLAHRLDQAGRPELARPLLERVLTLRPEEPQSRRDLALVCAELKDAQRAVDLLWEVVSQPWDPRFPEIELIALDELNAIAATAGQKLDLSRVDRRLRRNLPVGLRAVLTWDADACDIDLWVDDPNGERAIYNHPRTYQGGRMSRDFTGGYGPEEFLVRDPKPGKYVVRINYYGERRQTAIGPVTAQVRLITGFGTPSQKEKRLTVRLSETKESLDIGTIEIGE